MSYTTEENVRHYTRYLKKGKHVGHALARLLEEEAGYSLFQQYDTKRYASNYKRDRQHEEQSRRLIRKIERLQEESEGKWNQKNRRNEKRQRNEEKDDRTSSHHNKSFAELACENVNPQTLNKHRRSLELLSGEALLRVVERNETISKEVDYMFRKLIKKDFPHRCFLLGDEKGATETYKDVYERFAKDQKEDDRKEGPPMKKYKDQDGNVMYRVEKICFGEDDDDDYM